MSENYMFGYIFSKDTTNKILNGEAFLGAGGAKRKDGTMLEMGRPVMLNKTAEESKNEFTKQGLEIIAKQENYYKALSQEMLLHNQQNKELIEQCCALNAEGFKVVLEGVTAISDKLSSIDAKYNYHLSKDMVQTLQKLINYLKSDAGKLEAARFDVTNSAVSDHLDDASAFLKRLYSDVVSETYNCTIEIEIMFRLLSPFMYVMNRYSAQYYYDNGLYPSNYDEWVGVIKTITKDSAIYEKWLYSLRINRGYSLEEGAKMVTIQRNNNRLLREGADMLKEFALTHTKEEFLSIQDIQLKRYESKEYKLIEGCMYLPLD